MGFWSNWRWRLSWYYVDAFEKELDEFLCAVPNLSSYEVRERVLRFMKRDFVRFSVYLEWKFKGYAQLKKSNRRELYRNADLIRADFQTFCETAGIESTKPAAVVQGLMEYLSPQNHFLYQESSAFFGLLKNPQQEKLVGDCNQICSLYVALSTRYFLPTEWRIHLYDEHVALVFDGQELEATNGTMNQLGTGGKVLPIESLVAVNVLDISEKNRRKFPIIPERFLQSAALVEALSPENPLAQKNMRVALHNMGLDLAKNHKFELAEQYFSRLQDKKLLENLYAQAVHFYIESSHYSKAEQWAQKSARESLRLLVWNKRGSEALKQRKYTNAKRYFEKAQQPENVQIVLETEMFDWYERVKNLTKLKDLKAQKSTIKKIYARAKEVHHEGMIDWCKNVLEQI
ncbi:hypothetical protein CSB37_00305 [bacterium DOLZORAL124_38_8]|nr:MAG: hypothetical protein CSB37_00305 [bacterium DOLZORAL124_38_8]